MDRADQSKANYVTNNNYSSVWKRNSHLILIMPNVWLWSMMKQTVGQKPRKKENKRRKSRLSVALCWSPLSTFVTTVMFALVNNSTILIWITSSYDVVTVLVDQYGTCCWLGIILTGDWTWFFEPHRRDEMKKRRDFLLKDAISPSTDTHTVCLRMTEH